MFITMPIKSFELNGNKVLVNESVIEYENISDDTKEILESLISKGAYGSALLTLNMFYNVKSINESDYTQEDYTKYLEECNKLMEVCVSETEARNFRPLVNLNGLEIMENENYIARGKGNKLLIEDFRLNEEFEYTGNSKADEVVFDFSQTERDVETFTKALNEISRMEFDNEIDIDKYNECIKKLQSLFKNRNKSIEELSEECEGTQCSDIADKVDQEVGSLQKPKKPKKHFTEMLHVPKNHGYKGFRLNEQGLYTRGNYILINENGNIRAVNKNKLNEQIDIDLLYKSLHLSNDLEKAMILGASKILYVEEDEVKDYCSIEIEEDEDNKDYVRVYFLAEVSYEEGTKIVDEYLDDVISKYDKDAYFEAETSGRWYALVRKECLN